ncbi:MAG: SIS domain-containing protein [Anaerolineae bacterium]|nr:SIS domain-containing protein [Anaerolineae bacterium]
MNAALTYMTAVEGILHRIRDTQLDAIGQAAKIFANTIASDALVHMFATGHSRVFLEEMFPRYGSFPGFHPIVELSLTFHNQVVGANGQRQALFIEHLEGFAATILRNFVIAPPDSFLIFSNSGVNETIVDMAVEVKKRNLPLVAVTSVEHTTNAKPRHSSGKKLMDLADVVIDSCVPSGDAVVKIDGMDDPVGPASTIAMAAITNLIKVTVAEELVAKGVKLPVITSSVFIGSEASAKRFDDAYDEYRRRMVRAYGGTTK